MLLVLIKIGLLLISRTSGAPSSGENLTPKDVSLSKSLSWLLRHGAIDEGLKISSDGFIQLEDVLQHRLFARRCSPADIRRVVSISKNRFTLRANPVTGIYEIKANSGHTFNDQNNQENQKSEVKVNRGRTIPQPGLRSMKKNNNKGQKNKLADLLKNYNSPRKNIASDERHNRRGTTNFYDSLMKYPELKKALLWILRYGSEKEGLTVKRHGYVPVDEILTNQYFKDKCLREDIITVANNEPHNFKLRESPNSHQLYIRARKEHPIKQEQEDWSVIPDVLYLPLGFVIHGINGSDWDFVLEHGLKVPQQGYLYCSPYYAADSWHTQGVTKYDDIYIHINCAAAMQDGIEFFLTPEYSVATKGDEDGFIRTQYFIKVIEAKSAFTAYTRSYKRVTLKNLVDFGAAKVEAGGQNEICFTLMDPMTNDGTTCEACNVYMNSKTISQHVNGKKHKARQELFDKTFKTIFVTGVAGFKVEDLKKIFQRYGAISKVNKRPDKPFAFIQFTVKDSVENVLKARIFAGGKMLFVRRFEDNRTKSFLQQNSAEKSRKLSETSSNSSLVEQLPEGQTGVKELPVQLVDAGRCPEDDVVLWQARDFLRQVELPAEKYISLNEVMSDVENLFKPVIPNCQVLVFGSCCSTLAFKNSDVDLFLHNEGYQLNDFVRSEAKMMYRSRLFTVISRIPNARVPIIKFEHTKTGWQCDLSANSQLGVSNSLLIRFLVSLDDRFKPLVMIIKYWAKVCGLAGKFTTYSLVMFVIFYLQQLDPPILPTVAQLQQMSQHKQYSLGWECSFCDEQWRVQSECLSQPNPLSLRQLLTGFFRFYYELDLNNVLCPLIGKSIPVDVFKSDESNLPDEMFLYKVNLKNDPKCKFITDVNFRMQDPFDLSFNITKNVPEKFCSIFKEACKVSLALCENEEDSGLLSSLFSIDKQLLDVCDDLKVNIIYSNATPAADETSDSAFAEWYQLTADSIVLVLRQIYKFDVDPHEAEASSKVKKHASSEDVHTRNPVGDCDKLVFVCSGKVNVWNSRKKICCFMNSVNFNLRSFEREVCISNALFCPRNIKPFSFTMTVTPLDLPTGGKGITCQFPIQRRSKHPLFNGFITSMKTEFKVFVNQAQTFILNVRKSSPLNEVKESLEELFKLKLSNLPDVKKLMMNKSEIMSGNVKSTHSSPQQKILINNQTLRNVATNVENDAVKCDPSMKSPSTEESNRQVIVENIKLISRGESSMSSEGPETNKLNSLNTIEKSETQSTITPGYSNPFMSSIEKVSLKPLQIERKEYSSEGKDTENTINGVEHQEKPELVEGNSEEVKASLDKENHKENKIQDDANMNTQDKLTVCEISESEKGNVSGTIDDSIQTTAIQKTDVDSSVIEDSKDGYIERTSGSRTITIPNERPRIHSERPMKQRKPNHENYKHRNKTQKPQLWAGGGPPGCQPWQKHQPKQQPQSSASITVTVTNNKVTNKGTSTSSNTGIEQQKKWYPSLFRDNN